MRGILRPAGIFIPHLASAAALPVAFNPDGTKPVMALLGDSITAGNTETSDGFTNVGYWNWAQALSGFRVFTGVYGGVGGDTTTNILGRLETDIIIPMAAFGDRPKYCLVMGGVNDSVQSYDTVSITTGNLEEIYNALIAAEITPIACTITPTVNASSALRIANWNGINSWLRIYCPANGIELCDNIDECLGQAFPAVTAPEWIADYSHDGVHPTALGAQAIAGSVADKLESMFAPVVHFATGTADFAGSILDNHAMTGTGGSTSIGGSGDVADSWNVAYGVGSKAARIDGVAGEWQVLAIGAAQVRFEASTGIDTSTGFVAGDTVVAQAEIVCVDDWSAITQFHLRLDFRSGSTILDSLNFLINNPNTLSIDNPAPDGTLVLRTIPRVVPEGTTAIRTYLLFVGASGTIRVGRYELLKVAPEA